MAPNQNKGRNRHFHQNKNAKNNTSGNAGISIDSPKVKELKFHMHDLAQRKVSESFGKIKESIILKIQGTFENPRETAKSLTKNAKSTFPEPNFPELDNNPDAAQREANNSNKKFKWKYEWEANLKSKREI